MSRGQRENSMNTFMKGMNKDASKAIMAPEQYLDAKNLRITNIDGQGNGAMVNVKGTEIAFTIPQSKAIYTMDAPSNSNTGSGSVRWMMFNTSAGFYGFDIPVGAMAPSTGAELFDALADFLKSRPAYLNGVLIDGTTTLYDLGFRLYTSNGGTTMEIHNDEYDSSGNPVRELTGANYQSSSGTYGSGTLQATSILQSGGIETRIIGNTSLRDSLIIFTTCLTGVGFGQIWQVDIDKTTLTSTISLKYNRIVDFDINYPIEAVARYETNIIQRVYWTDNLNEVRSLNIAQEEPSNIDPSLIDLNPSVNLGRFSVTDIGGGGSLAVGVHQYCYRLISSDGALTKFSPMTSMLPILPGVESSSTFYTTDENTEFVGKDIGSNSGKSVSLKLTDIDADYDSIEIAHLYYSQRGVDPVVTLLPTMNVPSDRELEYTHSGTETPISFSIDEVIRLTSSFAKAKTLSIKDNRLFAANVEASVASDLTFNARAYRFKKGTTQTYIDDANWDVDPSTFTAQVDIDAVNDYNDVDAELDSNAHAYQRSSTTLGGSGQHVSYEFFTESVTYGDAGYGPGVAPGNPNEFQSEIDDVNFKSAGLDTTEKDKDTWTNYKSPHFLAHMKGYQRGEVYRFGVVLFDKKGRPGFVNWIGDIKFPHAFGAEGEAIGKTSPTSNDTYEALGIKISVTVPSDIVDNVSGFQIVRVQRTGNNKTILGTGAAEPTYNYNLDAGFSDDSASFVEGNTSTFIAKGIHPHNSGSTSAFNYTFIDAKSNLRSTSALDNSPTVNLNNLVAAFQCPDFHFLGDPTFKTGDKLRFIGKAYVSNSTKKATFGAVNWFLNNEYHTPYDGNGVGDRTTRRYANIGGPSNSAKVTIKYPSSTETKSNTYEDWAGNDLENAFTTDTTDNGRHVGTNYWYYSMYALDPMNITNYNTVAKRNFDLETTSSIDTGKNGQIGGVDFKNQFISFAITHGGHFIDIATSLPAIGSGALETYAKGQVVGDGNKSLAVKVTSSLNWTSSSYLNITMPTNLIRIETFYAEESGPSPFLTRTYLTSIGTDEYYGTQVNETELPIFQYVRPLANQYGGNTETARAGQSYIPCSVVVPITSSDRSGSLKVLGGDTMVAFYPITRSARRKDGKGYRVGIGIPVETTVATELRAGDNYTNQNNSNLGSDYIPDDYIVDSVYLFAMDGHTEAYFTRPANVEEVTAYDNRIHASNLKINGETVDSWRTFDDLNFIDVDGIHGAVNKLVSFKDEIYYIQSKGFGKLSINPRALVQTGGVGELQLGEGGVLDDFVYISTEYGSGKQFASVVTDRGIYFFDDLQNKLFTFSQGGLIPFSETTGVNSFFQDDLTDNIAAYDNPFLGKGISAVWDKKYNEVLYTLHRGNTATITGATRTSTTFSFPTYVAASNLDPTPLPQIRKGDTIEVDGLCMIVQETTDSSITVYEVPSGIGTSGLTIKYHTKSQIQAVEVVGSASGAFTSVDEAIVSTLQVGDWLAYKQYTGAGIPTQDDLDALPFKFTQITEIVNTQQINHTSGYLVGQIMVYGYLSSSQTISINEQLQAFTGFYSFKPNVYFNLFNTIWSCNPYNNTQVWLHDAGNYGFFYNGYYDSTIRLICNVEPRTTKVFDNITFQLEATDSDGTQNSTTVDEIRFHTDYQNTDWVSLDPAVNSRNIRRSEREWQLQIPRNVVQDPNADIFDRSNLQTTRSFKDRIRDKYMTIDLKIKNTSSNVKKLIHYVHTFFRVSKR
jgi:hypothetical protein